MDDREDQAAYHADMLKRQHDEEEALRRVMNGTATKEDAETLAHGLGIAMKDLFRRS